MYKITAIVLRAFAFSDSKLMVDVLSREEGRASCVVLVGSSKKGKSRRQLFQPMSLLELVVERKSVGSLLVVKDAHISKAFSSIPFDPYKLSISMFVAEFLCRVTMVGSESLHCSMTMFATVCSGLMVLLPAFPTSILSS